MSPSCLPMQSPERGVFSTHGDTYHAEESVLRLPFLLTQKTYVDSDSPKFLLGSFFSASSQAEFVSFFFPACRKSQMRPSQTRLPTCLFVALPCAQTVAFQCVFKARRVYSQYSANQSQEEEKPYKQSRQRRNQFEKVFFCTCFLPSNVQKKKFSVVAVLRRCAPYKSPPP